MIMRNKNTGFTLLELMIVVAISGLLLLVGIPSFRTMIATNEISSKTNDLIMSLKLARSTAITTGHPAFLCSSSDGETCKGQDNFWSKGWLVWVDLDENGALNANSSELLWVKEIDPSSSQTIIATSANAIFLQQFEFKYDGTLDQAVVASFQICSGLGSTGYPPRNINVTVSGEAQFSKDTTPGNEC